MYKFILLECLQNVCDITRVTYLVQPKDRARERPKIWKSRDVIRILVCEKAREWLSEVIFFSISALLNSVQLLTVIKIQSKNNGDIWWIESMDSWHARIWIYLLVLVLRDPMTLKLPLPNNDRGTLSKQRQRNPT